MRLFILITSVIYTSVSFGQIQTSIKHSKGSASYSLSFSTFNHAEWLFNGQTAYILTDKYIKVINTSFGEKKGKIFFSKPLLTYQHPFAGSNNFDLNSLKDFYDNHCVMATSGDEYFLDFKGPSMAKYIILHHYYLKQLDNIINLINSFLPKKY